MIKRLFTSKEKQTLMELAIVAEIHKSIDEAEDKIYQNAVSVLNSKDESLLSKGHRLNKLGFKSTKEAVSSREYYEVSRPMKEQAELISHYREVYPGLKFITEDALSEICDKYNLVFASVDKYTGTVPDKNITDIETAKDLIAYDKPEDLYYFGDFKVKDSVPPKAIKWLKTLKSNKRNLNDDELKEMCPIKFDGDFTDSWGGLYGSRVNRNGLFIAAPKSNFNLEGLTKVGKHGFFEVFKPEPKDPIVFRYVKGGLQILTKWGLEGDDPNLINF